jgi:hypothetical protein
MTFSIGKKGIRGPFLRKWDAPLLMGYGGADITHQVMGYKVRGGAIKLGMTAADDGQ